MQIVILSYTYYTQKFCLIPNILYIYNKIASYLFVNNILSHHFKINKNQKGLTLPQGNAIISGQKFISEISPGKFIDLKDLIIARDNVTLDTLISYSYPYLMDHEKISESRWLYFTLHFSAKILLRKILQETKKHRIGNSPKFLIRCFSLSRHSPRQRYSVTNILLPLHTDHFILWS